MGEQYEPFTHAGYDCGHAYCDERQDPLHDHFLRPSDCPSCKRREKPPVRDLMAALKQSLEQATCEGSRDRSTRVGEWGLE